jgi:hypothetical protein
MLNKISGLSGALATLLAIVAAFVAIPNLDVGVVLVVLGIVAGIGLSDDGMPKMGMATIALPVAATALATLPSLGTQLGAVASGWGLACAGSFACGVAIRAVNRMIATVKGLGASS